MPYEYYNNLVTPFLEQAVHSAFANASSPQSYAQRLGTDKHGDLWIRTFLINSSVNSRGWSVDPNTIRNNVLSVIGKPLVIDRDPVTGRIDHPQWDSSKSAEATSI